MRKKYIFFTVVSIICIIVAIIIYGNYKNNNVVEDFSKELINYDISKEIEEATKALDKNKKSEIISNVETDSNTISLIFEGMTSKENTKKILDLLDEHKIKASFFIPGNKAAEDERIVEKIKKRNHEIGNGTLNSTKNMQNLSDEELIRDFCYTNKILKNITNEDPILLKCTSTKYEDNILQTAYASGNKVVVDSNHYLSYQSFKNYDEAKNYIKKIDNGTVISIKLEGVLDSFEYGREELNEKPAIDKQPGLNEENLEEKEEVTIVNIIEWLLKAIKEDNKSVVKVSDLSNLPKKLNKLEENNNLNLGNDEVNNNGEINNNDNETEDKDIQKTPEFEYADKIDFNKLMEENNKKLSPVVAQFYTTQEALSYTFRGISHEEVLNKVLEKLKILNIKGTFFVTKDELKKYPDRINKIIEDGHEIANGGITTDSKILEKTTVEIGKEIYEVDVILRQRGINTKAYMAGYGYKNSNIQEALSTVKKISSLKDYELFTYSKAPIIDKYKNMTSEGIVKDYFNTVSYMSMQKGEIVYFRLDSDLYTDTNVIPNLIEILTNNYVENGYAHKYNNESASYDDAIKTLGYSILPLRDLQNVYESGDQLGRYNLVEPIKSLNRRNTEEAESMIKTNYIGNKYIDISTFTEEEKVEIDKEGTIDTNGESTIFFTFDDWGGDPIVNELLKVLDKHNVKGNFFVIGSFVDINSERSNINPNLLRTIAIKGHDIGSHNYEHETLNVEKSILDISIPKSYESLYKVIGDLNSLKPYFRAPELLVTRNGLLSVFESGFDYSISGNITTHDYERSAEEVLSYLEEQLIPGKGNVVVMHMNNQSYYTPEAVDTFLTKNENGFYGEVYKVSRLSDYLGK